MPKDKQQVRTQSRRAASKEALKQMHIILDEEKGKRYEISSDDDDVIEVDIQPPKKKYKLSHRKSSDDRDVLVLKSVSNASESIFDLDIFVEELTPAQKTRRETLQKEDKEIQTKIDQILKNSKSEVIYSGVCTTAVEITEQLQNVLNSNALQFNSTNDAVATLPQSVSSSGIVLQQQPVTTNSAMPQSYQLVMDPRLGVIVGTVATASNTTSNTQPLQIYQPQVSVAGQGTVKTTPQKTTDKPTVKTRRVLRQVPNSAVPSLQKINQSKTAVSSKSTSSQKSGPPTRGIQVKPSLGKIQQHTSSAPPSTRARPTVSTPTQPNFRPTESNVEGGLGMGKPPAKSIDLTGDDGSLPDSREISFNKLQGRTYPSLVVVARPQLRVKDLGSDRGKLDVKVKSVLMYPPTKFTEWLIQQGLVRSDQKCSVHPGNALKLGMYSDASKFPYSGGYVWISECCPQRFVSVFSGSLFEGSQHPPMAILKLLYHWCCQTIVQNVTQWVKVDNLYVKGMYTWLRAICTVGLHTHLKPLGGPGIKVQVGVISLGTTSQDGNKREVKVEVLGILETESKHIRLRAVEPHTDGERNYKKRFTKILEPVLNWVHPASIIVTDLTVDKATLMQMGFPHVTQNTTNDYNNSNRAIMEYLRRIVPRMFQNTLSLLSRQIIQQFLDELVWREWYGTSVLQCFENMIQHLSEQTRQESDQSLIVRLNKVAANPFKNWAINVQSANATTNSSSSNTIANSTAKTPAVTSNTTPAKHTPAPVSAPSSADLTPKRYGRSRKPVIPQQPPVIVNKEVPRPEKSTSPDVPEQLVPLENYYYGTISVYQNPNTPKVNLNIKCLYCKLTFNTNISLMNHLFKHAHNVSNEATVCKYCLMIAPSPSELTKHIVKSHPNETKAEGGGFVCLICETFFRNPFVLGKHMSKQHCPSELPYMCGTCQYRCSNHRQAIDHFYSQHDHGNTIQCPFCLKSTTIFSNGRNLTQNMGYFIQHLQKHQNKKIAMRCGRCVLWFLQKEFLKDHKTKMHSSQRGKNGLIPTFAPRNGVMVPKSRLDKYPDESKVINFSALYFNVAKGLNCKECDKPLSTPKHFTSFESCQNSNCQYSTCCSITMKQHVTDCKQLNSKLPQEKLPYEMFCVCGYSDIYGNTMAKHLAICERKSAYPSKAAAKSATVTHSMLDVLGLVRKPEESAKTTPAVTKTTDAVAKATASVAKTTAVTKSTATVTETPSPQPSTSKNRSKSKKQTENKEQKVSEVIELNDDDDVIIKDEKDSGVTLNISDVRGGVEEIETLLSENKAEEKQKDPKTDVTKSKSRTEVETSKNDNSGAKTKTAEPEIVEIDDDEEDEKTTETEPAKNDEKSKTDIIEIDKNEEKTTENKELTGTEIAKDDVNTETEIEKTDVSKESELDKNEVNKDTEEDKNNELPLIEIDEDKEEVSEGKQDTNNEEKSKGVPTIDVDGAKSDEDSKDAVTAEGAKDEEMSDDATAIKSVDDAENREASEDSPPVDLEEMSKDADNQEEAARDETAIENVEDEKIEEVSDDVLTVKDVSDDVHTAKDVEDAKNEEEISEDVTPVENEEDARNEETSKDVDAVEDASIENEDSMNEDISKDVDAVEDASIENDEDPMNEEMSKDIDAVEDASIENEEEPMNEETYKDVDAIEDASIENEEDATNEETSKDADAVEDAISIENEDDTTNDKMLKDIDMVEDTKDGDEDDKMDTDLSVEPPTPNEESLEAKDEDKDSEVREKSPEPDLPADRDDHSEQDSNLEAELLQTSDEKLSDYNEQSNLSNDLQKELDRLEDCLSSGDISKNELIPEGINPLDKTETTDLLEDIEGADLKATEVSDSVVEDCLRNSEEVCPMDTD